jgi:hypothetical protein
VALESILEALETIFLGWPDFYWVRRKDKNGHWGVAGSLFPGRWGGLRPPPVAGSISVFFFCHSPEKSPEMTVVDGVCSPEVAVDDGGQRLSSLVVVMNGCFDFILNLCFFLKRMRCQHVIGGKKPSLFAVTGWQQHSWVFVASLKK